MTSRGCPRSRFYRLRRAESRARACRSHFGKGMPRTVKHLFPGAG